nr:asparagine synthase-related protein [uncultured Schaedlerella sp.]
MRYNKTKFVEMLSEHKDLQENLFIRGFLITDQRIEKLDEFPFYGNWKVEKHQNYYFMVHQLGQMCIYNKDEKHTFFLMGHAYNPFTMEYEEEKILPYIAEAFGSAKYLDRINEITGVFVFGTIIDGKIYFLTDPSGMQSACYGKVEDYFYLSSHPQLIGDICDLEMDGFVKELISYKWYGRVMGPYLPADLTPFAEVKRVVPDICYSYKDKIKHRRFWPKGESVIVRTNEEYEQVIKSAADILKNNMALITKKWNRPWISLTGGIDSNTTFAAGNGNYDKFETFSYISAEKEVPDAEAAQKIAKQFELEHHVYHIPDQNTELKDFSEIVEILHHNNGYVALSNENELRKRIYLRKNTKCDVEVKSWVSETIRAYWYKHYGRKTMPKLSPKLYRNLYKIFIMNRKLAHKVDKVFARYIKEFEYDKISATYPTADIHYNEVTWGSWGGLNISEMKYCFDLTFPYNNRKFLELMFRVPLDKRISDQHHLDMKRYLNQELYDMGIRVVNMKETRFRAFALNIIFTINSILP